MKLNKINLGHLEKPAKIYNKTTCGIAFQGNQLGIEKNLHALSNYGKFIAFKGHEESLAPVKMGPVKTPVGPKLDALRKELKKEGLDALIISSCDDYLNETVDKNQSQRIYISNFTGSSGDAVVSTDKAFVIVGGIYFDQADKEVDNKYFNVEKAGLGPDGQLTEEQPHNRMIQVLTELAKNESTVIGYDPNTISVNMLKFLEDNLKTNGVEVELKPTSENLVDKIRGGKPPGKIVPVREIPIELTGATTAEKLAIIRTKLEEMNTDAMIVTNLGDIAYLTNIRGKDIDYSAVFKSKAYLDKDKAIVFCNPEIIPTEIKEKLKGVVEFKPENAFKETIKNIILGAPKELKIGYSPSQTTVATRDIVLNASDGKAVLTILDSNPIKEMRAIKNAVEMAAMKDAFGHSDRAVSEVINWLNQQINSGKILTEKDLENRVREEHFNHGANDLSFEIIPASGANGAIIHYSEADPKKNIVSGELVLLDTGGYYSGGYATDLTRTWLAGGDQAKPTDKQKEIYSLVLKGAIRALNAELPPGADGCYLDNIARTPIKEGGHNYAHSTGHGIGIVVHEAPPYISGNKNGETPLKEGMIFSIEPGIYLKGWGGVRFENIVTVVKHPDEAKAKEGWHKVQCLTYAPIDTNLIDPKFFDEKELALIEEFNKKSKEVTAQKE